MEIKSKEVKYVQRINLLVYIQEMNNKRISIFER